MSKLINWILVVIWMAVIFTFSNEPAITAHKLNLVDFVIKKGAHIFEYTLLYILLFKALPKNQFQNAFLLGLAYAFTDELHQLLIPGRTGMLRDVLTFDTIGLLLGAFISNKFLWKHK